MFFTLKDEDTIRFEDNQIIMSVSGQTLTCQADRILSAGIMTTNQGPIKDDVGLVLLMDNDDTIIIMSEHPLFQKVLFEELKAVIEIDYQIVLEAMAHADNGLFIVYRRKGIVTR